jgi:hypothetical protein
VAQRSDSEETIHALHSRRALRWPCARADARIAARRGAARAQDFTEYGELVYAKYFRHNEARALRSCIARACVARTCRALFHSA